MIVRDKDFDCRPNCLIGDPEAPQDLKDFFTDLELAEPINNVGCIDLTDECWFCGKQLTTPFVYWNGGDAGISVHPVCAAQLALGLVQDAFGVSRGAKSETPREAVKWLDLFASKKEYGIEQEEFPQTASEAEAA